MKQGIHPDYVEATVTCSCGNTFKTHATKSELHIELCNQCHPFYTGQQKFVDTGGRVQRFSDKFGSAASAVIEREAAERDARQKAHEEAASAAREVRAAKDAAEAAEAEKAQKAAKREAAKAEAAAATEVKEAEVAVEALEDTQGVAEEAPVAEVVEEAPVEAPEDATEESAE
jgi:large subunit ribosomal protein L31